MVVTSQEKLGELVSGLDGKQIELARLMDRFPSQVHLEPSDISEVTSRRVLSKNAEAQKQLAGRGIATRVVSVPSLELLLAQPAERQNAIIGKAPVKIAIEAAVRWGWDAVIGHDGEFIGMHGFGASAPAKELYKFFGITAEAVVEAATRQHNAA